MIELKEAAARLGVEYEALKKRCQRGKLQGMKVGDRWHLPKAVFAEMAGERGVQDYDDLYKEWVQRMERGLGYRKPISPRGVQAHEYGMEKFWLFLENPPMIKRNYKKGEEKPTPSRKPNLQDITPQNLKIALSNIPVDREKRNCHFSMREKLYNGFRSFYKFLVDKGLRERTDLLDLNQAKPVRIYEEARPYLTEDQLFRMIEVNDAMITGRLKDLRDHDTHLTKLLIYLTAFAGLRREEVQDLHVSHIDLKRQELVVVDGKGNKTRDVSFNEDVKQAIQEWVRRYRVKTTHPNLIVTSNGLPMDASSIYKRIRRAGKAAGVKINPHGLRRTCASVALEHGIPIHHISELFGHTRTSTTEKSYAKANKKKVLNSFKEFRPQAHRDKPQPVAAKLEVMDDW